MPNKLASFLCLVGGRPLQQIPVLIYRVGVNAPIAELYQRRIDLELNAHSHLPHEKVERVVCFGDRRFAVFVESPLLALPLDVVTVVSGRAAFQPVRKRFGVNACFGGCAGKDGRSLRASRTIRMRSGESFRTTSGFLAGNFCLSSWLRSRRPRMRPRSANGVACV